MLDLAIKLTVGCSAELAAWHSICAERCMGLTTVCRMQDALTLGYKDKDTGAVCRYHHVIKLRHMLCTLSA